MSYLLTCGYNEKPSLSLVGDHYKFNIRQRKALCRIALSQNRIDQIKKTQVSASYLKSKQIAIDGFNLLIFMESLLSGGYIFEAMDGVYRDIASIHGSYKKVEETTSAIRILGLTFSQLLVSSVHWYLDSPISNSGRLKSFMFHGPFDSSSWEVSVVHNPDRELIALDKGVVLSNDRVVLAGANRWFNLSKYLVEKYGKGNPHIIDWNQQPKQIM